MNKWLKWLAFVVLFSLVLTGLVMGHGHHSDQLHLGGCAQDPCVLVLYLVVASA